MHVALGTFLTCARTIAVTSLKELRTLMRSNYSPLARGAIFWIEITTLEQSKPELYRRSCVAVRGAENNCQTKVLVTAATLFTFVI